MADIIVTGYMARHPVAGNMLAYFHYVLGLARLGHRVLYLEEPGWPYSSYDPVTGESGDFPAEGLRRARALVARFCPDVPVVFADPAARRADGASWDELTQRIASCDLVLDVGGVCWLDEFELAPRRALVDMDPLFTQVGGFAFDRLDAYGAHFTYGGNIGQPDCLVPTGGREWLATPPPVVADLWTGLPGPTEKLFTTVANWTAYGSIEHEGRRYGQKDVEFRRLTHLPERVAATLEIAATGASGTEEMRRAGWRFASATQITDDLDTYRTYIADSLGELSAAKNAYVATRSGWFSDRSACYLASGRPVILQDTGFSTWLPTGSGLMTFHDLDSAAAAVEAVLSDPHGHAKAARDVFRGHLDAEVVLPGLLEAALT